MQDRYVGDKGDFGKYLLLKNICKGNLRLGVNWCLVNDEIDNNDGNYIGYLENDSNIYSKSDLELFMILKELVYNSKRKVANIEQSKALPSNTLFFSETIPFGTRRFDWHSESLTQLAKSDIIFYDPDNGLEINSCGKLHQKAVKYVFFDEVRDTFHAGKSIIIYQHANRSKSLEDQIQLRIDQLTNCLPISDKDIMIVNLRQESSRFYIIIKQPIHSEAIELNLTIMENEITEFFKCLQKK